MTVLELINDVTGIIDKIPQCSGLDAFNNVYRAIYSYLTSIESPLVKADLVATVPANTNTYTIPAQYTKLADDLLVKIISTGGVKTLTPINDDEYPYYEEKTGSPEHYRIVGNTLYLYPTPNVDIGIRVTGFALSMVEFGYTDDIPLMNEIGEIYRTLLKRTLEEGPVVLITPEVQTYLKQHIELTTNLKHPKYVYFRMIV